MSNVRGRQGGLRFFKQANLDFDKLRLDVILFSNQCIDRTEAVVDELEPFVREDVMRATHLEAGLFKVVRPFIRKGPPSGGIVSQDHAAFSSRKNRVDITECARLAEHDADHFGKISAKNFLIDHVVLQRSDLCIRHQGVKFLSD